MTKEFVGHCLLRGTIWYMIYLQTKTGRQSDGAGSAPQGGRHGGEGEGDAAADISRIRWERGVFLGIVLTA